MLCLAGEAHCQQDVDFHLNAHLFPGQNILKVKRDFHDPYLWVLAQNNKVYRVNSLTLAIDDYTSKFAAFSSLPFVDIAGRSQDTVFVATNSTSVIEYKKGIFKDLATLSGLSGTINEVGMDSFGNGTMFTLMIATSTGIYNYDFVDEVFYPTTPFVAYNRLFETTYRSEAFSQLYYQLYDNTKQYPVAFKTTYTTYGGGGLLYNTPEFGYHINTFYYTDSYYNANVLYLNQFWGTETGLFQNNWNESYFLTAPYKHYLTGIKVNKVTSIYGLTSFTSVANPVMKENLLIGTDQGFYFSNSGYGKFTNGLLNDYNTFTFDSDIGKKVINDVCVNATSYSKTICEDGVWVAATDGLYLVKPDYGKYLNSQTIQAVNFENQPDNVSSLSVCAGNSIDAVTDPSVYNGNVIQWYKNGTELPGESKNSLTINSAGDYNAVLYDPCSAAHFETNHLRVTTISSPVFSFNYPDVVQQCSGTPYTLAVDNNPAYSYRWYTNDVLNGVTTSSFDVTQNGRYKVEVSACTNSWIPSKEVEVDLVTLPIPQITQDKAVYCAEDIATLTVNTPVSADYTINWNLNGTLLPADKNLTSIMTGTPGSYTVTLKGPSAGCSQTSAALLLQFVQPPILGQFPAEARACNNGVLKVVTTGGDASNYKYRWYTNDVLNGGTDAQYVVTATGKYRVEASTCAGSWVSSNTIQVDIVNLPTPVLTADKPAYCTGDNATLTINVPADPTYTINWYKDGALLATNTNQTTVITNIGGTYKVEVVNNLANYDGTTCTSASGEQTLSFSTPPTVSIQKIIKTTLCDGQTVSLLASHNSGTVKWSTGETTDQINVATSGTYTATITSAGGCQVSASTDVAFLANPVFTLADAAVCSHLGPITLVGPAGYVDYTWNGVKGNQTYQVSQPGKVSLTITDENGCQATQTVTVTDACTELFIPNVFTPNGDGINDTWKIDGLSNNPPIEVRIFNRYGIKLFENTGYGTPWDGKYGGKPVPRGVYYYLINVTGTNKTYSGPLTVVY